MNWFKLAQEEQTQWNSFPYRQRELPFQSQPENPYQRKFVPDDTPDEYDKHNLYHVTTNLPAVVRDMQLKSRAELGGNHVGLGGGIENEAPNKISLTYNWEKAKSIYNDILYVSKIINGNVLASDIYNRLSAYNSNSDFESLNHFDEVLMDLGVPKKVLFEAEDQIPLILNKRVKTPHQRYEMFQALERALIEDSKLDQSDDTVWTTPTTGFTMGFMSMKALNPANVAIIQVVVRKNANIEHVNDEMEVRVSSSDVSIVRWMQPSL